MTEQIPAEENLGEKVFILTDSCMWEANRQEGKRAPHAIQVVDEVTGQTRYIKSGSRIRMVEGMITPIFTQELYNEQQEYLEKGDVK